MFTVVVENEYRDLAQLAERQARLQASYADPEFQDWFASWREATEADTRVLSRRRVGTPPRRFAIGSQSGRL
jgi:hypothetical protein